MVLTILGAALSACGSFDDLGEPRLYDGGEETGVARSALGGDNGLAINGLGANGLGSNGLGSNGLGSNGLGSNGLVTTNTQNWLQAVPTALTTMPYLVACAAASGTSVRATVNGVSYSWPGNFGLAPNWLNNTPLTKAQQEWVSACLLASVNLAGRHVMVSFRTADATLSTTPSELSTYNCREAAFMGNLFTATTSDPLPVISCHDSGAQIGTGRQCDPSQGSGTCPADCSTTCDASSGPFSSCSVNVNGTLRTYSRIITTYLPTNGAQGCLGWGYTVDSRSAAYTSGSSGSYSYASGGKGTWNLQSGWTAADSSCSAHCGGNMWNDCSCTPDCASKGTCCSDYASMCGTPPPYVPVTTGQSTCPAGYTSFTGTLNGDGASNYWPSASGYTVTLDGTQHATMLGPSSSDFDLGLEYLAPGGTWTGVAYSDGDSEESLHYFYGKKGTTYRWKIESYYGAGSYKLCMNDVRGSTLTNLNSGKCIGAMGAGVKDDTNITQSSCLSASYQGFRLQSLGSARYTLVNVNSGMCLDVRGGSVNDGTPIIQWFCSGAANQQWDLISYSDGTKALRLVNSGKCMTVAGAATTDGAQLIQGPCTGASNQRFWIQ